MQKPLAALTLALVLFPSSAGAGTLGPSMGSAPEDAANANLMAAFNIIDQVFAKHPNRMNVAYAAISSSLANSFFGFGFGAPAGTGTGGTFPSSPTAEDYQLLSGIAQDYYLVAFFASFSQFFINQAIPHLGGDPTSVSNLQVAKQFLTVAIQDLFTIADPDPTAPAGTLLLNQQPKPGAQ
jgi:hypothetical protein